MPYKDFASDSITVGNLIIVAAGLNDSSPVHDGIAFARKVTGITLLGRRVVFCAIHRVNGIGTWSAPKS